MGCNCKDRSGGVTYPYEATLKDGTKAMVTSASDLHTKNQQAQVRMRRQATEKGYTVSR
jgi:hypothetical protein